MVEREARQGADEPGEDLLNEVGARRARRALDSARSSEATARTARRTRAALGVAFPDRADERAARLGHDSSGTANESRCFVQGHVSYSNPSVHLIQEKILDPRAFWGWKRPGTRPIPVGRDRTAVGGQPPQPPVYRVVSPGDTPRNREPYKGTKKNGWKFLETSPAHASSVLVSADRITPSRGRQGRGWRPGRRGWGRTRRGRRGPGGPSAGRARCGGSRSPCGRSDRPG